MLKKEINIVKILILLILTKKIMKSFHNLKNYSLIKFRKISKFNV